MAVQMSNAEFNALMNRASPDVKARNTTPRSEPLMAKPKPKAAPKLHERIGNRITSAAAKTPKPIRQHAIRHGTNIAGWFAALTGLGIAYAILTHPNLIVVPLKLLAGAVGAILGVIRGSTAPGTNTAQPGIGA